MNNPMYKRVLLKISGEALSGDKGFGINNDVVNEIAIAIQKIQAVGVEVSVVVGGGNFWRGRTSEGMDRTTADYIGMLATVMNSLALQDALENIDVQTRVQTAIEMRQIAEPYMKKSSKTIRKRKSSYIWCRNRKSILLNRYSCSSTCC